MSNYFTSLIIFMKSWQHKTLVYIVNPPFHQSKSRQIDHDTGIYVHDDSHVIGRRSAIWFVLRPLQINV